MCIYWCLEVYSNDTILSQAFVTYHWNINLFYYRESYSETWILFRGERSSSLWLCNHFCNIPLRLSYDLFSRDLSPSLGMGILRTREFCYSVLQHLAFNIWLITIIWKINEILSGSCKEVGAGLRVFRGTRGKSKVARKSKVSEKRVTWSIFVYSAILFLNVISQNSKISKHDSWLNNKKTKFLSFSIRNFYIPKGRDI